MYAKKITPAPAKMPGQPNRVVPVAASTTSIGGMNGCQLPCFTNMKPKPMTSSTMASFTATITLLKRADSLMPTTSSAVSASTSSTAGRLMMAPVRMSVCVPSTRYGALESASGMGKPMSFMMREK